MKRVCVITGGGSGMGLRSNPCGSLWANWKRKKQMHIQNIVPSSGLVM